MNTCNLNLCQGQDVFERHLHISRVTLDTILITSVNISYLVKVCWGFLVLYANLIVTTKHLFFLIFNIISIASHIYFLTCTSFLLISSFSFAFLGCVFVYSSIYLPISLFIYSHTHTYSYKGSHTQTHTYHLHMFTHIITYRFLNLPLWFPSGTCEHQNIWLKSRICIHRIL